MHSSPKFTPYLSRVYITGNTCSYALSTPMRALYYHVTHISLTKVLDLLCNALILTQESYCIPVSSECIYLAIITSLSLIGFLLLTV